MPEIRREPADPGRDVQAVLIPAKQRLDSERMPVVVNSRRHGRAGADTSKLAEPAVCGPDGFVDHAGPAQRDKQGLCDGLGEELLAGVVVTFERVNRGRVKRHEP